MDFPLKAMVSLNNPFDLWLAINLMRNTPYERVLANELKSQFFFKPKATASLSSEVACVNILNE